MFTVGFQGRFQWLVTDETFDLLELCPEIVLGKFVAVTSFDSGQFLPSDKETAAGWQHRAKIAYSPKVEKPEDLPRAGWDEWYIFNTPTDLGTSHLSENIFEVPGGGTPKRTRELRFRVASARASKTRGSILATNGEDSP